MIDISENFQRGSLKKNGFSFIYINVLYLLLFFSTFSVLVDFLLGWALYKLFSIFFVFLSFLLFFAYYHNFISRPLPRINLIGLVSLFFLFFSHLIAWLSGCVQNGIVDASIGLMGYLVFLLPVVLFLSCPIAISRPDLRKVLRFNTFFALTIGFLGFYQVFFDPSFFGIYDGTQFDNFSSWSVKRAAGPMGSVQVYSAYIAFSLLFYLNFVSMTKLSHYLTAFLLFVLGSLGGSQLFILLSAFSIFIIFFRLNLAGVVASLLLLLLLISSYSFLPNAKKDFLLGGFSRVLSIFFDSGSSVSSLNGERFYIWGNAITHTPFMFGNGLGSASLLVQGADRFNTESYLISAYYEGGFVLLFFYFSFFLFVPYILSRKFGFKVSLVNTLFFFSYAAFVHVYFSVLLFVPWLILMIFGGFGYSKYKERT